jgi:MFS family permease
VIDRRAAQDEPVGGPDGSATPYRWVVLATGTLAVFASLGLARFGYSIVLPPMQRALGLTNTQAGTLATANLLGYLVLAVVGGALASRFGPRLVITAGLVVAGVAMLMTGLAAGFSEAALWRALTGIGSGASNVPVMGLVAAWFGAKRRGLASGIAVSGSSLALILLGPTAPEVLSTYGDSGWRVCWFGFGSIALIVAVLSLVFLRNRPRSSAVDGGEAPVSGTAGSHQASSLRWGTLYGSAAVWRVGLVYTAFGFSYIIYMTFFVKALVAEGGYSQPAAGRLFMTMGWCSLLCGVIWGAVSDAFGRKQALIAIYLVQAAAFGLFALWPTSTGFTASAVLFGLTAWSIPAVMAATCGDMLGARLAPAALGFITLFLGVGQALGPAVAGAMADATGSLMPAMLLAAGVALIGALGAAFLRPVAVVEEC